MCIVVSPKINVKQSACVQKSTLESRDVCSQK